jgi:uncharacterized membrane protein HdeD (DUF308 family)
MAPGRAPDETSRRSGHHERSGMSADTRRTGGRQRSEGAGWVNFAGVMLVIIGVLNVIDGIAAIDGANVYVRDAKFTFGDLETWGWVLLITGAAQALTGVGVLRRNQAARWVGVAFVSFNMLAQFLSLPAYPLLALALFAADFAILFALLVYADPEFE